MPRRKEDPAELHAKIASLENLRPELGEDFVNQKIEELRLRIQVMQIAPSGRKRFQKNIGRDCTVSAGDGSVVIGGDVNSSVIVTGDHNLVNINSKFTAIYKQVDKRADLPAADKSDLKSELQTFEYEDKKGPESNEGFLAQRLRNIKRIAPDILDVVLATITSPAAGFGVIAKKVAEKMKAEVK
jgi:hypothetical protein